MSISQQLVWLVTVLSPGYYVPSIAHTIHKNMQNYKALDSNDKDDDGSDEDRMIYIRLGGMALGNAWVDARVQGPATIDYAYWHGLIDQYTQENLHAIADRCLAHPQGSEPKPFHAFTTPDDCAIMEGVLEAAGKGVLRNLINGPVSHRIFGCSFESYASMPISYMLMLLISELV
jgi:hypothetical protein